MRLLQITSSEAIREDPDRKSDLANHLCAAEYCKPGFVYLVDAETMAPVEVVLRYLTYCARNRKNLQTTIKTKCDHLYDWVSWVHRIKPDLIPDSDDLISDYQSHLESWYSPKTRAPLAYGTIRSRIVTVKDFMTWAGNENLSRSVATPRSAKVIGIDGKPVSRRGGQGNSVIPAARGVIIEWIRPEDLSSIFNQLGSDPFNMDDDRSSRDWLIALFAATTGARLHEILALTWLQIIGAKILDGAGATVDLLITKGKREPRQIVVPVAVVQRLLAYIDGERKEIVAAALKRKLIRREPRSLFLNGPFCRDHHLAKPFQNRRVDEAFARAQRAAGLTRSVNKIDRETGEVSEAFVPKHCFHHLRHTYAVEAYHFYKDFPEDDRWIKIQQQLGHASFKTTANIYLRAVSLSEANARDAYSLILKRLIDG